jgi:hypothetical protein
MKSQYSTDEIQDEGRQVTKEKYGLVGQPLCDTGIAQFRNTKNL